MSSTMALATASASCHTVSADEQTNRSKLSAGGGGARKQYLQLVGGRRRERRIELDNVLPLRVEVDFRHVFGE
jgi:hypothetical protein